MQQGIIFIIIGAVLVYGAKFFVKILKMVSLLAFKIIGLLIAIVGALIIFGII